MLQEPTNICVLQKTSEHGHWEPLLQHVLGLCKGTNRINIQAHYTCSIYFLLLLHAYMCEYYYMWVHAYIHACICIHTHIYCVVYPTIFLTLDKWRLSLCSGYRSARLSSPTQVLESWGICGELLVSFHSVLESWSSCF